MKDFADFAKGPASGFAILTILLFIKFSPYMLNIWTIGLALLIGTLSGWAIGYNKGKEK